MAITQEEKQKIRSFIAGLKKEVRQAEKESRQLTDVQRLNRLFERQEGKK